MNHNQRNLSRETRLIIPKTYGIKYAGSKLKILAVTILTSLDRED